MRSLILFLVGLSFLALGLSANGAELAAERAAASLVDAALGYELAGDNDRRAELLREALVAAEDYAPANWHSGRIHYGGKWRTISDAQELARENRTLAEYAQLRNASSDTAAAHLALARWCRKHRLEQARVHWLHVLRFAPQHDEALQELGLRWFQGMLVTHEEYHLWQRGRHARDREDRKWQRQFTAWRRAIEEGTAAERASALDALRVIRDPAAIASLEQVFSTASEELALEAVAVVAAMPEHEATLSLVRHAVFAEADAVRSAATVSLRSRQLHEVAPILLSMLTAPIELQQVLVARPGYVGLRQEMSTEGPSEDLRVLTDMQVHAEVFYGQGAVSSQPYDGFEFAPLAKDAREAAEKVQRDVQRWNERVSAWNQRIYTILSDRTGEDLGSEPTAWWDWWQGYNELQTPQEKPEREAHFKHDVPIFVNRIAPVQMGGASQPPAKFHSFHEVPYRFESNGYVVTKSCFPAGTIVWAETGPMAIERIRVGDRVLSQHPETGELAFKPVLDATIRPPSPLLRMRIAGEELATTKGHPMWKINEGWRMAKLLETGDSLHSVAGAARISSVEALPYEREAHNLVVADFSTYFVGEAGVLVHDNTFRRPTRAAVPGLISE